MPDMDNKDDVSSYKNVKAVKIVMIVMAIIWVTFVFFCLLCIIKKAFPAQLKKLRRSGRSHTKIKPLESHDFENRESDLNPWGIKGEFKHKKHKQIAENEDITFIVKEKPVSTEDDEKIST